MAPGRWPRAAVAWHAASIPTLQILLWRWGFAAPLAVAIAIGAGAVWLLVAKPVEQRQVQRLFDLAARDRMAHRRASIEDLAKGPTPEASDVRSSLPPGESAGEQIRVVAQLAMTGQLSLPFADYLVQRDALIGVQRTILTATIKSDYLQTRDFIETLLRSMPNVSLDRLSFRRENISQQQVEVQLQLSIWGRSAEAQGTSAIPGRREPLSK